LASEREEALKKAEKLLRQGKLEPAIAEYVRLVEEQPRDWNLRNALGDLYVRAGQIDKAAAQYLQIGDHLMHEGFFARAGALYKKILKIKPDEESVQMNLGEVSAKQGLLADAKSYFVGIGNRRRARGDRAGADEIAIRLGSLDPADFDARTLAAQTLERSGDAIGAAMHYRAMHADLLEKGRPAEAAAALRQAVRLNPDDTEGRIEIARAAVADGNLDAAKDYLDRTTAGDDPALLMALLEIELRSGALQSAREMLPLLLKLEPSLQGRILDLTWTLASTNPGAAAVCIDTAVENELAAGNFMDAAAMLQEFVTRVPGQIEALQKLVDVSVDGGLEAIMYETQAHLADAYLEKGQAAEARVIAEDLVAREPWEHAHIDRFRRALEMLQVPDPDAVIADRLSGQGPFTATDLFMPPEPFRVSVDSSAAPVETPPDAESPQETAVPSSVRSFDDVAPPPPSSAPFDIPAASQAREVEPDIPLRPRAAQPAPPARPEKTGSGAIDIDLNDVLAGLHGGSSPKAPPIRDPEPAPAPPQNLDQVFNDFRTAVARHTGANEASEQLALAKTYLEMGMTDEAAAALRSAARGPAQRFEAASLLGRLYQEKNDMAHAIEWLERAAEAPAPGVNEARELLYDLGALLESTGETARALAVFLELQADAGDYRDVAARVDRLSRVQTGG
jgi:tetratricopeptide (TPR) repeat protein